MKKIAPPPSVSEKRPPPSLVPKIATLPNYPMRAPVLKGTARSAKNSLCMTFINNVS